MVTNDADESIIPMWDLADRLSASSYVGTPLFNAATSSDTMQEEINRTPMRRMAEMDEVADCITFLVSPLSSFVCGTSLVVDG